MSRYKVLANVDKGKFSGEQAPDGDVVPREKNGTDFVRPSFLPEDILERFIEMREVLFKKDREPPVKIVGVTSSKPEEGKTRISICLAVASAIDPKKRVLLVDGNLRNPSIHKFFQIPVSPGLSEMILEDRDLNETIQQGEGFPLNILTSGAPDLPPMELFSDTRFPRTMTDLKNAFDIVIVDVPSVKQCADFEMIGKHLDGMILVLEADKTQLPLILEAKARLDNVNIPILGTAINRLKSPIPRFISRRIGLD